MVSAAVGGVGRSVCTGMMLCFLCAWHRIFLINTPFYNSELLFGPLARLPGGDRPGTVHHCCSVRVTSEGYVDNSHAQDLCGVSVRWCGGVTIVLV